MLFFQKCIIVFSFRTWSSMEWWGFTFKIKQRETSQRSVSGSPAPPPRRTWSRHWQRSSGLICGCCPLPSTPSTKCTSVEVSVCPQAAASPSLPGRLTPAASSGEAGAQCTGRPGRGRSGKSVLSLQHLCLLGVRKTVLMLCMLISPKVSSVAFPN